MFGSLKEPFKISLSQDDKSDKRKACQTVKWLDLIGSAKQIHQKCGVGFRLAIPVIDAALESVQRLRQNNNNSDLLNDSSDLSKLNSNTIEKYWLDIAI